MSPHQTISSLNKEIQRIKKSKEALDEKVAEMERVQRELKQEVQELKEKMLVKKEMMFNSTESSVEVEEINTCRFEALENNVDRINAKMECFSDVVEHVQNNQSRFDRDLDFIFERMTEAEQYPRRNSVVVEA